jgi:hypothetical protein
VRRNRRAIAARIVGQEFRFRCVDAICLRDEMKPKLDVVSVAQFDGRLGGQVTVGVVDLMEEVDDVGRPGQTAHEFSSARI